MSFLRVHLLVYNHPHITSCICTNKSTYLKSSVKMVRKLYLWNENVLSSTNLLMILKSKFSKEHTLIFTAMKSQIPMPALESIFPKTILIESSNRNLSSRLINLKLFYTSSQSIDVWKPQSAVNNFWTIKPICDCYRFWYFIRASNFCNSTI